MLMIQTMQWRRWCQTTACRRPSLQAGVAKGWRRRPVVENSVDVMQNNNISIRCFSTYQAQTAFYPLDQKSGFYQRRLFSKFSTDEVVIQDPGLPPTAPPGGPAAGAAAGTSTVAKSSSAASSDSFHSAQSQSLPQKNDEEISEKLPRRVTSNELLVDLQEATELFHQIYNESKILLRNNQTATMSDEVVAMVDYFMILVNSLDLENYLGLVQSLKVAQSEKQGEEIQNISENSMLLGEKEVEEKLRQAMKSMSQLHHVLLSMVESCLPLNPLILSEDIEEQSKCDGIDNSSFDKEMYCPATVQRAMQLSQRAEELGMPLHRPLYQRLAVGVVLTSAPPESSSAVHHKNNGVHHNEAKEPSVIQPMQQQRHFRKINQSLHPPPPLPLKLMEVFQHARSAHKIHSNEQLHYLAEDILATPFLLLLKWKRWEDAAILLQKWDGIYGHSKSIDLLSLLGERHTLVASEIAKVWLADDKFEEEVQTNPHAIELTGLLEVALGEIVDDRRQRADDLSHLLSQVSVRNDDSDLGEDADYEFEVDFDYDSDEELDTPTPTDFTQSDSPATAGKEKRGALPFGSTEEEDKGTVTVSHSANSDADTRAHGDGGETSTIIKGLSDKEVRKSMYVRNGTDWVLPDIVPQLEGWNKGNQLTFTPEFEKYLGHQIMKGMDEDEDDEY